MLAGRYALTSAIGRGGFGEVWAAEDRLTGERVAVKRFVRTEARHVLPARAEIAHLRLLAIPGIARLIDEGLDGDVPFLVMELVEGEPFPGRGPGGEPREDWATVEPVARALLTIVGRVHDAGIVHLDLKPDNVLVDRAGRVTVLDFGLAVLRTAPEEAGPRALTPDFAAPEQLFAGRLDRRTDLFAIGRMVRRALDEAPEPELARWLRSLISSDPDRRPRSAHAALAALDGAETSTHFRLPWLGPTAPLDEAADALAAGRSVSLVGRPGEGGRRRLLEELTARLVARDQKPVTPADSAVPFESLEPLAAWHEGDEPTDLESARRGARGALERARADGVVLVLPQALRLDRWSALLLDEVDLPRLDARGGEAAGSLLLELAPLTHADLHPLFAGPDRVLHLAEDGATELLRRTGGDPAAVAAEVAAWVETGLAHWTEDPGGRPLLAVDRPSLGRLAGGRALAPRPRLEGDLGPEHLELVAWLDLLGDAADRQLLGALVEHPAWLVDAALDDLVELGAVALGEGVPSADEPSSDPATATIPLRLLRGEAPEEAPAERAARHRAVAEELEPGHPQRLRHLLAAGAPSSETVPEACRTASAALDRGDLDQAEWRLAEATRAARLAADPSLAEEPLLLWAEVALARHTAAAFDRVLNELDRFEVRTETVGHLAVCLRGALQALDGSPEAALRILGGLAGSGASSPEVIHLAHGFRVLAARGLPLERQAEVLASARLKLHELKKSGPLANLLELECLGAHRRGDYTEAAELAGRAADSYGKTSGRVSALLNRAMCLLDGLRPDDALATLQRSRRLLSTVRLPLFELRCSTLLLAARYRFGELPEPDEELLRIARETGSAAYEGNLALTHAAVAWRAGDPFAQARYATMAAVAWERLRYEQPALLARSLACPAPEETTDLLARIRTHPESRLLAQARWLLGDAPAWPPHLDEGKPDSTRLEVLSIGELRRPPMPATCT